MAFPAAGSSTILAEGDVGGMIFWCLVVVGAIVGGFMAVTWVRKWAAAPETGPGAGFTLGDLRELHRSGKMSDEEYERAKAMIVGSTQKSAAAIPPNGPQPARPLSGQQQMPLPPSQQQQQQQAQPLRPPTPPGRGPQQPPSPPAAGR